MVFASCAQCNEPTQAADGLCQRCRFEVRKPTRKDRRERVQPRASRRR